MRHLVDITNRVFQNLLIVYLIMLLVNEFKLVFYPNVTTPLLVIVLVLGVISALFYTPQKTRQKRTNLDTIFMYALGIIGTALVFVKTKELGWLSYVISAISGVLIVLLGYLVYDEDIEDVHLPKQWLAAGVGGLMGVVILVLFIFGFGALRIIAGSVYVLFVPGFALTFAFFKEIDWLERIALSFALSIAVVPLVVFYLNLAGMPINTISVALVVLAVTAIGFVIYKHDIRLFKGHSTR